MPSSQHDHQNESVGDQRADEDGGENRLFEKLQIMIQHDRTGWMRFICRVHRRLMFV